MSDSLTHAACLAIAQQMRFTTQAYIDGTFRPALSGEVFATVNPATGQVIAEVDGAEMSFVTKEFRRLAPGDAVSFALSPDHLHIFDRASGRSLLNKDA